MQESIFRPLLQTALSRAWPGVRQVRLGEKVSAPAHGHLPDPLVALLGHTLNSISVLATGRLVVPLAAGKIDGSPALTRFPGSFPIMDPNARAVQHLLAIEAWSQVGVSAGDTLDLQEAYHDFRLRVDALADGDVLDPRDDAIRIAADLLGTPPALLPPAAVEGLQQLGASSPSKETRHDSQPKP